jgi:hypothetical protein
MNPDSFAFFFAVGNIVWNLLELKKRPVVSLVFVLLWIVVAIISALGYWKN